MLFGMFLPYSPFAQTLGFQALPMLYWFILLMMMLAYIVLAQSVKQWYSNHYES
jgi:Mg2+-importing ATPase